MIQLMKYTYLMDIDKVSIVFTDTDDKFKKIEFIIGDKI